MTQHNEIALPVRRYTRVDFTALRAYLYSHLPIDTVLRRYYSEDDLAERGIDGASGLRRALDGMRDDLIARLIDANPRVAETLGNARAQRTWSRTAVDYLIQAADARSVAPRLSDPVSAWFLPIAAKRLKQDGIVTMQQLMRCMGTRGPGWYKPIPCIGQGKAAGIVAWLRRHRETLGEIPESFAGNEVPDTASLIVIEAATATLAPLERMALVGTLDGSSGINRPGARPLIAARNDLEAIRAYLYKHRENDKTHRAYQKELERFVLWCIKLRQKALSSVSVEDCEAYKDFLAGLPEEWIAPRRLRASGHWRPFAGQLTPRSRKYALTVLRAFFSWCIDVRYLAGNPWAAVADPRHEVAIRPILIEKALPEALWEKLTGTGGFLETICALSREELHERYPMRGSAAGFALDAQWRLLRAAVLLIGTTGIRREEASNATRDKLKPSPELPGLHELAILGKRGRWREVFLPEKVAMALNDHWRDRGEDFSCGMSTNFLLSPVLIPNTARAQAKHRGQFAGGGFSASGLYGLIKKGLRRIADDPLHDLTEHERSALRAAGVHALRHTCGTGAVAAGVPLDVVQQTLGHASLNTTTIYTQGEKKRKAREMGRYFDRKAPTI